MKKYVVAKVKVNSNMKVKSILEILFESNSFEKTKVLGEVLSEVLPLEKDEYVALGQRNYSEICLN